MFLTLGDSVCWGQGLLEEHKFDAIFAASRGLPFTRVAHSGAVIGAPSDSLPHVETGEVPVSFPSSRFSHRPIASDTVPIVTSAIPRLRGPCPSAAASPSLRRY